MISSHQKWVVGISRATTRAAKARGIYTSSKIASNYIKSERNQSLPEPSMTNKPSFLHYYHEVIKMHSSQKNNTLPVSYTARWHFLICVTSVDIHGQNYLPSIFPPIIFVLELRGPLSLTCNNYLCHVFSKPPKQESHLCCMERFQSRD